MEFADFIGKLTANYNSQEGRKDTKRAITQTLHNFGYEMIPRGLTVELGAILDIKKISRILGGAGYRVVTEEQLEQLVQKEIEKRNLHDDTW